MTLSATRRCPSCGRLNRPDDAACTACGSDLTGTPALRMPASDPDDQPTMATPGYGRDPDDQPTLATPGYRRDADDQPTLATPGYGRDADDQPTLATPGQGGREEDVTQPGGARTDAALPDESADWPLREAQYETLRAIGQGGMGAVWLVRDRRNGRQLCLKRPQNLDANVLARFLSEIQVLAANWCKDIVECIDFGRDVDGPFFVMPFYRRGSLQARIKERGPLDPKALLDLAKAMGRALCHLHGQSILHRDIKPANILLTDDEQPVLADFGLVRVHDSLSTATHGNVFGTAAYMAPELQDGSPASVTTDIYSLGLTLRYAATGCLPGAGRDDEVPAALRPLILRCTRSKPTERFQSAQDFLRAVENSSGAPAPTTEIACPHCSTLVDRAAQHCGNCGKSLFVRCGACAKPMRWGARHCEKCGCSVETWNKVLALQADAEKLLRAGRFDDVLPVATQLSRLHAGAVPVGEALRRRLFELEPKVKTLRRRGLQAEREMGPRAAASLWTQLLELCPADTEALLKMNTLEERSRRHAFLRSQADVEALLDKGELDDAGAAIAALRDQANNAAEKQVVDGFDRRLADARKQAADALAAEIAARIRRGDVQGARAELGKARNAGCTRETLRAFEAQLDTIQRAVWRRDLGLTAGVVAAIVLLVGGFLFFAGRSAWQDGLEALRQGRFADARRAFDKITPGFLQPGREPAKQVAETLARAGGNWDAADATAIADARRRIAAEPALADLVASVDDRLRAALRRDLATMQLVRAGGLLRRRTGEPLAATTAADGWNYVLAPAAAAATGMTRIACRIGDDAPIEVEVPIRSKDTAPALTRLDGGAADGAVTPCTSGRPFTLRLRVEDATAQADDRPAAVECAPADAAAATATLTDLGGGTWQLTVTATAIGESSVQLTARDFCDNRSEPLVVRFACAAQPAATAAQKRVPPAIPQLLGELPARSNAKSLRLVARAAEAVSIEVVENDTVIASLVREGDVFANDIALADGAHALTLRAVNGELATPLPLPPLVVDRTPPTGVGPKPAVIDVGERITLTADETLGDASVGLDVERVDGATFTLRPLAQPGKASLRLRLADPLGNAAGEQLLPVRALLRTAWQASPAAQQAYGFRSRNAFLAPTADGFAILAANGVAERVACGDLGGIKLVASIADPVGVVFLHASGQLSAWSTAPTLRPIAVPRLALRPGESAVAMAALPGSKEVFVVTTNSAFRCDWETGSRTDDSQGPPAALRQLVTSGSMLVAVLADGRIAFAPMTTPREWSGKSAAGPAPAGATHLVAAGNDGDVLVGCSDGTVLRGRRSRAQRDAYEWTQVVDAKAPIAALACDDVKSGFAVATATGGLSIYPSLEGKADEAIDVPLGAGEVVTTLLGPRASARPGSKAGRQIVYSLANGRITAVDYE